MSKELKAMRNMAWERAKGEIRAMLETYYAEDDGDKFENMEKLFDKFVEDVENSGLQE